MSEHASASDRHKVLIIEDNPGMALALVSILERHDFEVAAVDSGFEGEDAAATGEFDAVLLDLLLPDRNGIDVARNLRRRRVPSVIIVVSGLADLEHVVTGLEYGADDYVTKPFDARELVARLRAKIALTRRLAE